MPATSEKQKNFMKMVLAHKDGKLDMSKFNDEMTKRVKDAAKSMSKKQVRDFVTETKDETKEDFDERQKRIVAGEKNTSPEKKAKLEKIPGYKAAVDLAKKTVKEDVRKITFKMFLEQQEQ